MNYLNTNLKWEDFFIQESIELEEQMASLDIEALAKSKLRLSLEKGILDWKKYEDWVLHNHGCSSLKSEVTEDTLKNFAVNAQQAFDIYSNYKFWNEDLVPVFTWEKQLVVFGLQYNENLISIENHIFILAKPEILSYFSGILFNKESAEDELGKLEKSYSQTISRIEGLAENVGLPKVSFKKLAMDADATITNFAEAESPLAELPQLFPAEPAAQAPAATETHEAVLPSIEIPAPPAELKPVQTDIWDFINERHDEYCFEAKKLFSAYIVLKIDDEKTKVFKMDPDLKKQEISERLFEYSLREDNPFSRVMTNGVSESFNVSQLGLELLRFKYACITTLRHSGEVVGFLVGFKKDNLSEDDQVLLEELAKEAA